MEVIKRIIPKCSFSNYDIPSSFGEAAEIIILPYKPDIKNTNLESNDLMKAQEFNGAISLLTETEEDIWDEL